MTSASGRYVIAYNGEIYNAPDIRSNLDGVNWRGHSDTEVIIEAVAAWGIRAAFGADDRHVRARPLGP